MASPMEPSFRVTSQACYGGGPLQVAPVQLNIRGHCGQTRSACAILTAMSGANGSGSRLDRVEKIIEAMAKKNEAMAKQHEAWARQHEATSKEHDRRMRAIDARLTRFISLGVIEARNHRKKMKQLDGYVTKLAAAQLVTEEKLQRFISRSGNGHGR